MKHYIADNFLKRIYFVNAITFAFLCVSILLRFCTIFHYNSFIKVFFILSTGCCIFVLLFPKYLKTLLFFFGTSFFLFGFRAYDIQSQVFETIVAFMALALFVTNVRNRAPAQENRHLLTLILCYIGLSVFSLALLPVGHIIKSFWLFGLKSSFLQVANATPNIYVYALAGINRLILFSLFALEVSRARNARELLKWVFVGIFTGGVFCAFAGFLDYYGIISLRWYSRTVTGYALSSTFLNRSWLAEFILIMVPFVLIGFMSKIKGLWWKILLFGTLIICEIALILAGARAGWVSYPLILFICWLFFYFSKEGRLESFQFRWWNLAKVAISVPITIAISFLLIFQVVMPLSDHLRNQPNVKTPGRSSKSTSQYIKTQTARLVEPSGRVRAWMQGVDVGRENPLFGMGYESFGWHANILSAIPKSYYTINKDNKHSRVLDTPHNIFFQLFVSGGAVGLCLWILIIGYGLMILTVDLIKNKRLLNTPVIISIMSFHVYGLFQSMQYIPMIWMFIFLNLGYALTIEDRVLPLWIRNIMGILVKVSVIIVVISSFVYWNNFESKGLAEKYGLKIYAKDQDRDNYIGFYHLEKWPTGNYRWSGRKGIIRFSGKGLIEVTCQCHSPGVEKDPVILSVFLDEEPIDKLSFTRKRAFRRQYYVYKATGDEHELLLSVSRTWNPKKSGINLDNRDLGLAVSEIKFLDEMPKDGIGFHDWETWGGGKIPGWPNKLAESSKLKAQSKKGNSYAKNLQVRFRWTGMRASIDMKRYLGIDPSEIETQAAFHGAGPSEIKATTFHPDTVILPYRAGGAGELRNSGIGRDQGIEVFLMCAHPGIDKDPVRVQIIGDGGVIREEVFKDDQWKKVIIRADELKGSKVLTFQVSRTWNPKLAGISEDSRDLGVAVTVLKEKLLVNCY